MSFRTPDHVLEEQIGEEIVLLSLQRETFFSLNSSGIELWAAIKEGADRAALAARLVARFGLEAGQAEHDANAFVDELLQLNLIEAALAD
jgi:hypothetical protein